MSVLQSRNPAMRVLESEAPFGVERAKTMTLGGTVTATSILLSIVAVVGVLSWQAINSSFLAGNGIPGWAMPVMIATLIGTIVVSLIIYKAPRTAPIVAPLHAILEGAFVGVASFIIPMRFLPMQEGMSTNPGAMIAAQAATATLAVTAVMLGGYATGVFRVGPLLSKIMMTALFGLIGYTLLIWVLSMFGVGIWNGYADTGMMGIGFTVLCAGLASMFLLPDFQFIEKGVQQGAPKYMEWVGAWGLMVTLVWLYIELLRLLSKLQSRD